MKMYDFILAGGGVAGLSLAYHLLQGPLAGRPMLVVDRSLKQQDDRTLSFWTAHPTPYDAIVARSWQQVVVAGPDFVRHQRLARFRYQTVRGLDFYRFVHAALDAAPNVTRLHGRVTGMQDGKDGATVWIDGRAHFGHWVFDSRFDHAALAEEAAGRPRIGPVCLWQHFQGWEVETPGDSFDEHVVTLMDFRTQQQGEWRFFYVLPFTARRALVELVSSGHDANAQAHNIGAALQDYIGSLLKIREYQIVRRESGVTPLTTFSFPRRLGRHIMAIGVRGGRIKPSTGYGFLRMQEDAASIALALQSSAQPFDPPTGSGIFRWYDRLMLHTLSRHRRLALPLFSALLQRNPIERVLRFLDESASPAETLQLTASLAPRILSVAFSDPYSSPHPSEAAQP